MVCQNVSIMTERLRINTLSDTYSEEDRHGSAVVMVGSFAPIHDGHFDAVQAASVALEARGVAVESLILTPNSAEYLEKKLPEDHTEWPYQRRIQAILDRDAHTFIPTYVDDVSGYLSRNEEINDYVPLTIRRHLGFKACQLYLVVGSDQLLSMESHLSDGVNRAVCVLRPGSLEQVQERLEIPWVAEAVEAERFIITERRDMENDISSTAIRTSVVAVEEQ